MTPYEENILLMTRRQLFGRTALGMGTAALATLLRADSGLQGSSAMQGLPHFPPKAKRVIN